MDTDTEGAPGVDLDGAADRIGAAVFGPVSGESDGQEAERGEPVVSPQAPQPPIDTPSPAEVAALDVPSSWPKEMHEHWGATPRKVQEYWTTREKQMLDGLEQYKGRAKLAQDFEAMTQPFQQTLRQLGISPIEAAQSLLQADHRLRYATPEQKMELAKHFLKNYGIDPAALTGSGGAAQPPVDPMLTQMRAEVDSIRSAFVAQQQAALDEARARVAKEVDGFASDSQAHPYFDEVADKIAEYIQLGRSLQDAYEEAVWANPVTRAKEQARLLTEHEAKLKENARLDALPKKRAASVNVKSSDTTRTPTEPVGTLEETIRDVRKQIQARAS